MTLKPIARLTNDFESKFGLPRQSGLNPELVSRVIMEKEFASPNFLRGIEGFSHLWLIWGFDVRETRGATVRPPKLGGNVRLGVFATRSPFRPNPLGLTVVKLLGVSYDGETPALTVSGADAANGTLIYDIKPYIPYADAVQGALGSFADEHSGDRLNVRFPQEFRRLIPENKLPALINALSLDPRPQYIGDPSREYGFGYAGRNVRFKVNGNTVTVTEITEEK